MKSAAKIGLLTLILVCSSCKSDNQQLPEGILSQEKMIDVMVDLQMMEAAHKSLKAAGQQQQPMLDTSYQIVFNKYGITWADYDSSMAAYTLHPELFSEMLNEVGTRLNSNSNSDEEYNPDIPQI